MGDIEHMDQREPRPRRKIAGDATVLKFPTGERVEQDAKSDLPAVDASKVAPRRSEIVEGLTAYGERPGLSEAPGRSDVHETNIKKTGEERTPEEISREEAMRDMFRKRARE